MLIGKVDYTGWPCFIEHATIYALSIDDIVEFYLKISLMRFDIQHFVERLAVIIVGVEPDISCALLFEHR
ncbi:hypothetical protein C5L14_21130 [Labrys okinawensis]|uniref:Uncharacterized protein n=1 Tax=Labrys okinawensis TaxID=346911 RepID=A0A2S9Q877_9HYPH|nr:hypothetical protein C5L14_21130 [Labrys okinawensis]